MDTIRSFTTENPNTTRSWPAWDHTSSGIGPEHGVGVEQRDESVEVPLTRCGQERLDDGAMPRSVRVGHGRALHPATSPAGQLPSGVRGPVHDRPAPCGRATIRA